MTPQELSNHFQQARSLREIKEAIASLPKEKRKEIKDAAWALIPDPKRRLLKVLADHPNATIPCDAAIPGIKDIVRRKDWTDELAKEARMTVEGFRVFRREVYALLEVKFDQNNFQSDIQPLANLAPVQVFTFGYGNRRDRQDLQNAIAQHDIALVIDVRISPRAWSIIWHGEELAKFCKELGIEYANKRCLGNTSGSSHWIPPDREAAREECDRLKKLSRIQNILLLCAETDFQRCHRTEVAKNITEKVYHVPPPNRNPSLLEAS